MKQLDLNDNETTTNEICKKQLESSVKGKLRALNTNIRKKRRQDINGLNFQCNKLEKSILKLKKIESWK